MHLCLTVSPLTYPALGPNTSLYVTGARPLNPYASTNVPRNPYAPGTSSSVVPLYESSRLGIGSIPVNPYACSNPYSPNPSTLIQPTQSSMLNSPKNTTIQTYHNPYSKPAGDIQPGSNPYLTPYKNQDPKEKKIESATHNPPPINPYYTPPTSLKNNPEPSPLLLVPTEQPILTPSSPPPAYSSPTPSPISTPAPMLFYHRPQITAESKFYFSMKLKYLAELEKKQMKSILGHSSEPEASGIFRLQILHTHPLL